MARRWKRAVLALVFAVAGCGGHQGQTLSSLPADSAQVNGYNARSEAGSSQIRHIIIIVQENRTPDNLFQGLPGADIASSGKNKQGQIVPLHAVPLEAPYDIGHSHVSFLKEWDGGKMDGFNLDFGSRGCPDRNTCAYGYVPQSETQPYLDMAEQYAFADRMFQSNEGPSFPAHQYLISGTSTIDKDSNFRAADNPYSSQGRNGGGCDTQKDARVDTIDLKGRVGHPVYPCFERPTLGDLLDKKRASWRYYEQELGPGLWHPYDAIKHIRYGPDDKNIVTPPNALLSDIRGGTLANVSWVSPDGINSDHANSRGHGGPGWVSAIVNAMGKSRYWNDCAIFVTWDDWGGWYDHVAPPIMNSYELSFRVPLVVISPYAKPGYVSHTQYEFGSILKFVEQTFATGSLGTTDMRANSVSDMFNFSQRKRAFVQIKAPPYSNDTSAPDSD